MDSWPEVLTSVQREDRREEEKDAIRHLLSCGIEEKRNDFAIDHSRDFFLTFHVSFAASSAGASDTSTSAFVSS